MRINYLPDKHILFANDVIVAIVSLFLQLHTDRPWHSHSPYCGRGWVKQ